MLPSLERLTLGARTDAILVSGKPIHPKPGEKRAAPAEADEGCAICGEPFGEDDTVYLKCEGGAGNIHRFHVNCLKDWHDRRAREGEIFNCPMCREQVVVTGKTKFVHEAGEESDMPPPGLEWMGPPPPPLDDYVIRAAVKWCKQKGTTIYPVYGPVERWNVSKVTDMSRLFMDYSTFNADISGWDVSKVQNMSYMFCGASDFNQNLSSWDVNRVETMASMFEKAKKFNSRLFAPNPSRLLYAGRMFYEAEAFEFDDWNIDEWQRVVSSDEVDKRMWLFGTSVGSDGSLHRPNFPDEWFAQDVLPPPLDSDELRAAVKWCKVHWCTDHPLHGPMKDWDVSNVTSMTRLFHWWIPRPPWYQDSNCAFDTDISEWKVGKVTDMYQMFERAHAFNADISEWQVGQVKDMYRMFAYAKRFNADISKWNVSSVENMEHMFENAHTFNQDLSKWKINNVTSMDGMFRDAKSFNSPLFAIDTECAVTDMSSMFHGADEFNQDLSHWDLSRVLSMRAMFERCTMFNSPVFGIVKLPGKDVVEVYDTERMFLNCQSFDQDLSAWDLSGVTYMAHMLYGAVNFGKKYGKIFKIGGPSEVKDMSAMFGGAASFNEDLSHWKVDNVEKMVSMFEGAIVFNSMLFQPNPAMLKYIGRMFYGAKEFEFHDRKNDAWQDVMRSLSINKTKWLSGTSVSVVLDGRPRFAFPTWFLLDIANSSSEEESDEESE